MKSGGQPNPQPPASRLKQMGAALRLAREEHGSAMVTGNPGGTLPTVIRPGSGEVTAAGGRPGLR